jgi:error-prone DNA polymerase
MCRSSSPSRSGTWSPASPASDFPKVHGAAFGLLAYQSTWLRVHHPSEFLCALLSEQPMGFYPPDSLIHEAQHREVIVLPPDVLHSEAECTVNKQGEIRVGLNYVKGVHTEDIERLIASRHAGGAFRNLADFAARAGVSTPTLKPIIRAAGGRDVLP